MRHTLGMAKKHATSFRLAEPALDAIKALAAHLDCSQAEAIESLALEWQRAHQAEATVRRLELLEARIEALEQK